MTKEQLNGRTLLTEKEAAVMLSIKPRTLINWRNQGRIPFIRIGRTIRYKRESLESALRRLEINQEF